MRGGRPGDGPRRGPAGRAPGRAAPADSGRPPPRAEPVAPPRDGVHLGVRVGELGRAHGVRGEVRVKSFTQDPLTLGRLGPLTAADGRRIVIEDLRRAPGGAPDMLIARIAGVSDRNAAEALTRLALYAPREALGVADAPDEWLVEDLIGLEARDAAGTSYGRIVAVPDFGAGDLLEILPPGARASVYLPFTKAFAPHVDVAAGHVVIAPPEDFLAPPKPSDERDETDDAADGDGGGDGG
jgi:16S rRNA processing protein RimM